MPTLSSQLIYQNAATSVSTQKATIEPEARIRACGEGAGVEHVSSAGAIERDHAKGKCSTNKKTNCEASQSPSSTK